MLCSAGPFPANGTSRSLANIKAQKVIYFSDWEMNIRRNHSSFRKHLGFLNSTAIIKKQCEKASHVIYGKFPPTRLVRIAVRRPSPQGPGASPSQVTTPAGSGAWVPARADPGLEAGPSLPSSPGLSMHYSSLQPCCGGSRARYRSATLSGSPGAESRAPAATAHSFRGRAERSN